MNQKKKQEKNKFSKLRLRSSARVSKKADSPQVNPREKISSYFSSSLNESTSQINSEEIFLSTIESQYGQSFSSEENTNDKTESENEKFTCKINLNDTTDEKDFAELKTIKPAKVFEIKSKKVKKKQTKNNNNLARFVKDFGASCSDTNQEHLHLAYAMSKSLEEYQNPGQSSDNQENTEYENPCSSTQQKIAKIKSTLDQFGFKTNRLPIEITTLKNNANQKKFKFLTPTLFLRTEEDREKLIESKVSRIFDNIAVYNKNLEENEAKDNVEEEFIDHKPRSFLLREFYDENATIFRKNHLDSSEINESTFYNNTVPQEIIKSGVLLKDWGSIPGRERTPPLSVNNITVDETEEFDEKLEHIVENQKEKNVKMDWDSILARERRPPLSFNITVDETEELQYENQKHVEEISEKDLGSIPGRERSPHLSINITVDETEEPDYKKKKTQDYVAENKKQKISEKDLGSIPGRETSPHLSINITVDETEEPDYENKKTQDHVTENKKQKISEKGLGSIPGRERSPSVPINIIVDETEEPDYENNEKQEQLAENKKQNKAEVCKTNELDVNTTIDHCISPDLFSDSDLELSIQKSPIKSLNLLEKSPVHLNSSSILLHTNNSNKETSPIILISSTNSNKIENSPVLSDDSDAKSLSLLDNISPRRNKNKLSKKSINSPFKKSLFTKTNAVSIIDIEGVTALNNSSKNSSPFETLQNENQICHYESFCDNSIDCFDLTQSSSESNDNYPIKDNQIIDDSISANLFESEVVTQMGGHDDNYSAVIQIRKELSPIKNKEDLIDLTQSSNEAEDVTPKTHNNFVHCIENKNVQINNSGDENSNDSVKTVLLLNRNNYLDIVQQTEEIETIPLQNNVVDSKTKFDDDYSPEFDLLNPCNNKDFYKSLSFISDSENEAERSPKKILKPKLTQNNSLIKSNIMRRTFSENIIGDKNINFADKSDFFKLSSPLNITKYFSQPLRTILNADNLDQSFEDIEISDEELNYSVNKCKKSKININDISRASNETEINYSINKSKLLNINKASCSTNVENINPEENMQLLSQSSIGSCSEISDEELNYSTNISFNKTKLNKQIDDIINTQEEFRKNIEDFPEVMDFNDLPESGFEPTDNESIIQSEVLKHPRITDLNTPSKFNKSISQKDNLKMTSKIDCNIVKTPENSKLNQVLTTPSGDYVIKTTNVTPMPNYNEMNSPELIKELDKFGVKPLKRAKGIKLLQYIYDATHPILQNSEIVEKKRESSSEEERNAIIKRRKISSTNIPKRLSNHFETKNAVEYLGNEIANSENVEDMIFERKQSVRIASCRLPLHIAWHNLLSSNPELHEKILLYEPIQVEDIYAKLKSFGYKFHIQDIISFFDKKCITIRVAQNNHQKKKSGS